MGAAYDLLLDGHFFQAGNLYFNSLTAGYWLAILMIVVYFVVLIKNGNYILVGLINTIVISLYLMTDNFPIESRNILLIVEVIIFMWAGYKAIYKK